MANTAKFDRRQVLERATRLFWQKGFHATSTRDLQQAIDMRPGSIYAAFGSKSGLFREVLHFYTEEMSERLQQCLAEEGAILDGLRTFLRQILLQDGDNAPSELCLLAKSLSELDEGEAELLSETRALLAATEENFRCHLQSAIAAGELSAQVDPGLLARQLQVEMIGLRSYLRATGDRDAVRELADNLFAPLQPGSQ
ncbi:HTH-type transcriptional repressor ComR [Microbulbifer aestuariivivens]|uniref:HTH-type transcriptional repressor ComR n=1 Tax=Microbulbifer aestuariivivens TaxID=1908308 RepID=A0ABP9WNB5_9GAMM